MHYQHAAAHPICSGEELMTNSLTHIGPALAACMLLTGAGFVVRRPLARVPENTPRFAVGVSLFAFGTFCTGGGLDVPWSGRDLSIVAFALLFLGVGLASVVPIRRPIPEMSL
jgi:uncharacterized membrane protein